MNKTVNEKTPQLNERQQKLLSLKQEKGSSTWLTTLPLESEGYYLNKTCFRDLICLRYGWELSRLPVTCECGSQFTIDHALSCKKGGFISMRHNELRNFTAKLLRTVCRDVTIEPTLEELNGEILPKSNNSSDNARLDISARGFWTAGQKAFFDFRVFNPLAKRHAAHKLSKCYELNEKEKKTHYNKRILEVEHGSFTPLVFAATGETGRECKKVYKRLAEMISEKEKSVLVTL